MAAGTVGTQEARRELEALIARVAQGDREAFEALYARTCRKLFGLCLRISVDRARAEEALQDAYVKIWRGAGRYRSNGLSPMSWLIAITRNAAIDRLRASRPGAEAGEALDRLPDAAPGPEAQAVARSEAERIAACMGELDAAHADAVRGAYLGGETYAELARRHAVPINTMRSWLRRSLQKLKECVQR